MEVIENCLVTKGSTKLLKLWCDDTTKELHSGIDLSAREVYSISNGVIIEVGQVAKHKCVTVQYDEKTCVRYMNLDSVSILLGHTISFGDKIGDVGSFVHFEYLTPEKSLWPVRIGPLRYYKHDPIDLLTGKFEFKSDIRFVQNPDEPYTGKGDDFKCLIPTVPTMLR